jgi:DUF438 domain-containing protein
MSEVIDNAAKRQHLLKHMILQLHEGKAPEAVKKQLADLLGQVPYDDVVKVEQELIAEGLPQEEVLKLCDVHSAVLKGQIDHSQARQAEEGHPVHTFIQENRALQMELGHLEQLYRTLEPLADTQEAGEWIQKVHTHFNNLQDVDKHYRRKEYLLFPFLEKHGITGPPTVMWGKHDETRALLGAAHEALLSAKTCQAGEAKTIWSLLLQPAMTAIEEMIYKEEQILFPMCLDTLEAKEWLQIFQQSHEIGFCLYDPPQGWSPADTTEAAAPIESADQGKITLPTGTFTVAELQGVLNALPFDITFVDQEDRVRYFSQGAERIFDRNRSILGRKVQMCHPPSSVHIVEKILQDFRSGKETRAPFWINLKGRFVHIEYFAVRDDKGAYLGTLEVTQDLTEKRALQGEQRLLSYAKEG